MTNPLRLISNKGPAHAPGPTEAAKPSAAPPWWEKEREELLELLAQQQRVAQAGLMTAGLSHDVKNHIQVMVGTAQLALLREDPSEWKLAIEKMQEQCFALSEITTAFLSFVKRRDDASQGGFLLSAVLEQVETLLRPFASKQGIALTYDVVEDGGAAGELRLAVQAVVNLASNAIRACTENGGEVFVTASRPMEGLCRLEVRDTGPGIPDEIRPRFFRPFATGHRKSGGNGLGLVIVRQVVKKLRGSIRVRTCSKGTIIQLEFPDRRQPR